MATVIAVQRRLTSAKQQARAGYLLSLLYVVLLVGFGLVPGVYAVYLAFIDQTGRFTLDNFATVIGDFRYGETFLHVGVYTLVFLVPSLLVSIGLALILQSRRPIVGASFRFIYYLPQGLIGVAGVIVWLFMLTPAVSPVGFILEAFGYENLYQVVSRDNLAVVLAIIAIWTSANGILLMYAALSSISSDVIDAARLDGGNSVQIAWYVKLPMIRKWVAYTVILNIAASTQLFAEPQIMGTASGGAVGSNWAPLQLAYSFAYTYTNFPAAAALSLQLLIIAIVAAIVVIKKTNLFRVEI